jgi:ubiquitin carboxyl-terminal hydrolase 2/21
MYNAYMHVRLRNSRHCSQHDSQEFMRFLVSGLHEELKKESRDKPIIPQEPDPEQWWTWYRELEKSRLMDVFVGQLRSSLTCGTCGHCSVTFDPFWELSISLPSRVSPLNTCPTALSLEV